MTYDNANIFARILRGELPCHRVHEDDDFIVIMDINPQAPGHTLILPKLPTVEILDADESMLSRLMPLAKHVAHAVREAFAADGVTLFQNNGVAGGQSVFHMHLHVVPRHHGRGLVSHGAARERNAVLAEQAERIGTYLASRLRRA